jgi:hypothetical protein
MRLLGKTDLLHVFESEPFVIGGEFCNKRRLYVGFDPTDCDVVHTPMPVVTALVSFSIDKEIPMVDWLETCRVVKHQLSLDDECKLRDDFTKVVLEHLPGIDEPDPETCEEADGTVHYLDTVDALVADQKAG